MKSYMEVTHNELVVLQLWIESVMSTDIDTKIERAVMLGVALEGLTQEEKEQFGAKIVLAHRGMHQQQEGGSCAA